MRRALVLLAICGISCVKAQADEQEFAPYIINGIRSPVAPYFAYIRFYQGNNFGWGGGALVSNQHIVTSASIVVPWDRNRVYLGGNNRELMREHEILNYTAHPNFDRFARAFDIAVVRLANAIIPSAEVHPVALPPLYSPPNSDLPFEHEEIFVDGYGMTSAQNQQAAPFLYRSHQRITSGERCQAFFILDVEQAFCGEDRDERSNVCFGDLGSPAIGTYRRNPYLAGIVRIHPTCGTNQPAAFTRVSFFLPWIQSQLI